MLILTTRLVSLQATLYSGFSFTTYPFCGFEMVRHWFCPEPYNCFVAH